MSISIRVTCRLSPQFGLWSMARMKKQNEKHEKMNRLAKLKTRKGGLGKNEHPTGLTTYKGNSGKNRGNEKIYSPVDRKPERAIQAKIGWWWKNKQNKSKHAKSIDHRCDIQNMLNIKSPSSDSAIGKVLLSTSLWMGYSSLPSAMVSVHLPTTAPPKGVFTSTC